MNNSFKNFLYNKNDIIWALVILVVAMTLIFWRLDVINKYPAQQAAKQEKLMEESLDGVPSKDAGENVIDKSVTPDDKKTQEEAEKKTQEEAEKKALEEAKKQPSEKADKTENSGGDKSTQASPNTDQAGQGVQEVKPE